jgi:tryptophan 2,3-dioxygenase
MIAQAPGGPMSSQSDVTYGGYLKLPELLACQKPASGNHDEMLFIILHQTMELWMKQALYEIDAAQTEIDRGELVPAYKNLARVSRIQAGMTQAWDILATMTPADYLAFREVLGTSSGFQSAQFRTLEYRLGLKDEAFLKFHEPGSAAGCDALLVCSREDLAVEAHAALVREAETSAAFRARIEEATSRVVAMRRRMPPPPTTTDADLARVFDGSQAIAAELAARLVPREERTS